jgi:hypothetical protein
MSSAQRWKRAAREIAALLGGTRIPNNGYGQPDVIAGRLAVQVKTRTALPGWFLDAVDQSIWDASPDQLPVLIVAHARRAHPTRRHLSADLEHVLNGGSDGEH